MEGWKSGEKSQPPFLYGLGNPAPTDYRMPWAGNPFPALTPLIAIKHHLYTLSHPQSRLQQTLSFSIGNYHIHHMPCLAHQGHSN